MSNESTVVLFPRGDPETTNVIRTRRLASVPEPVSVPLVGEAGDWHLYRFWGRLPAERGLRHWLSRKVFGWREVLLYLGETGREVPLQRLLEHVRVQHWAGQVTHWELDSRTWPDEESVLVAETAAIRRECPLWNQQGNSPHGAPRIRRRLERNVTVARWRRAGYLLAWLAVTALLWAAVTDSWPGWHAPAFCALTATVVLGTLRLLFGSPLARLRRHRYATRNRYRRRARA